MYGNNKPVRTGLHRIKPVSSAVIGQRSGSVSRDWFKPIFRKLQLDRLKQASKPISTNRPIARHRSLKNTTLPPSRRRQGPRPKIMHTVKLNLIVQQKFTYIRRR